MSVVPASKKLTEDQLEGLAKAANIEIAALKAFCEVEGGGIGFSDVTGRIIIRFEESHFKDNHKGIEPHGAWEQRIVNQTSAWAAFLDATNIDKKAAMLSTSIGIMQVMGENHLRCNFDTVEDMWLYNEISEANQIETAVRFIMDDPVLYSGVKRKDWKIVEERYNGIYSRQLATKLGVPFYSTRMENAYIKFSNGLPLNKTTTTVNLRSGGDTKYPVLAVLPVNTTLQVKNKVSSGWSYVKVISTEMEGWINSKFVS